MQLLIEMSVYLQPFKLQQELGLGREGDLEIKVGALPAWITDTVLVCPSLEL